MRIPEVLAPAGDEECLDAALRYGADAVYLGSTEFGMRASAARFDEEKLTRAVQKAHAAGAKLYLTCNTVPHHEELKRLPAFLQMADRVGVDALIISDLGVFSMARRLLPDMELHVSTQAGVVNEESAKLFASMGAKRVVLAREMTLEEIRILREHTLPELEIEVFVHGAMCMSVSGRCLLSHYMTGRDANQGACAQPCRWKYALMEEKRPGQYFPVEETADGSYILNAKDLCLLGELPRLIEAGVTSLKIEGRAKSSYYVAAVTNAYRMAVDAYLELPEGFVVPEWLMEEVRKVSHRCYSTGFLYGIPDQYPENAGYLRSYDVVGVVDDCKDGMLYVTQKNKFSCGETVELLMPKRPPKSFEVSKLFDESGVSLESACHPMMKLSIPCPIACPPGSYLRRKVSAFDTN